MIDYKGNTVSPEWPTERPEAVIVRWDTMFITPVGVMDLESAIKFCESHDMDPNLCIKAVSVAVAEDGYKEVAVPR